MQVRAYLAEAGYSSLVGALGFAATVRNASTGDREAVAQRHANTSRELLDIHHRLGRMNPVRPRAVIEEDIAKTQQDRRWSSSNACRDASIESSHAYCRMLGDLRVELASAAETDALRLRATQLRADLDRQNAGGALLETDPQAGLLARVTGVSLGRVQA